MNRLATKILFICVFFALFSISIQASMRERPEDYGAVNAGRGFSVPVGDPDTKAIEEAIRRLDSGGVLELGRTSPNGYRLTRSIIIDKEITIDAQGNQFSAPTASGFWFSPNTPGLIIRAQNVRVAGLMIGSIAPPIGTTTPTNRKAHGVIAEGRCNLIGVRSAYFPGDGFHFDSASGNLNGSYLESCFATQCGGHGLYIRGADANGITTVRFQANDNGGWGIFDSSFLGCYHFGAMAEVNKGWLSVSGNYDQAKKIAVAMHGGEMSPVSPVTEADLEIDPPTSPGVGTVTVRARMKNTGGSYFATGGASQFVPIGNNKYGPSRNQQSFFMACYQEGGQRACIYDNSLYFGMVPDMNRYVIGRGLVPWGLGLQMTGAISAKQPNLPQQPDMGRIYASLCGKARDSAFDFGTLPAGSDPGSFYTLTQNGNTGIWSLRYNGILQQTVLELTDHRYNGPDKRPGELALYSGYVTGLHGAGHFRTFVGGISPPATNANLATPYRVSDRWTVWNPQPGQPERYVCTSIAADGRLTWKVAARLEP